MSSPDEIRQQMIETASTALVKVLTAPKKPAKTGAGAPKPVMTKLEQATFASKVLAGTGQKFLGSTAGKQVAAHALIVLVPAVLAGLGVSYLLYRKGS